MGRKPGQNCAGDAEGKSRQNLTREKKRYHQLPNADKQKTVFTVNAGVRYPTSVLEFNSEKGYHPTQKPVALCEYLIRTYTDEGETVLDCCMGSGTTGVACRRLHREFVGIEKDAEIYEIAKKRIEGEQWNT